MNLSGWVRDEAGRLRRETLQRMMRADACTLNRIAQLIAGAGAAQINYRGMKIADIDRLVLAACVARKE